MKITDVKALEKIANDIRIGVIEAVYSAKSGHPGGSLSCADILTVLYFNQMNINEKEPNAKVRDRFEKERLLTFRNIESNLQGHPDMNKVPGVDMTSGSLGQGLSVANGMALASKLNGDGYRVYCLLGDGEIEEGQVWEAAMTSNKYKLDNLCVIVDNNNLQIDGKIEEVKGLTNIGDKFKSFGFEVLQIDGNNIEELLNAFNVAKQIKGRPTVIIAKTIKGKGVSFMENKVEWHGRAPKEEEYKQAIEELSKKYAM